MPAPLAAFFLLQSNVWDLVSQGTALTYSILFILLIFSIVSWTIIFSKWSSFGAARKSDERFLRAFRKANGLEAVVVASEQFRPSPMVAVFDQGYQEVSRQVKSRGRLANPDAIERSLHAGHQRANVAPRTKPRMACNHGVGFAVYWIVGHSSRHHSGLSKPGQRGQHQSSRRRPGISEALIATAVGLFAAIPAAIAYNAFGHRLKEIGARMDDFSLEFLNLIERSFGE